MAVIACVLAMLSLTDMLELWHVAFGAAINGVLIVGWLAERFGAPFALSITAGCGLVCIIVLCVMRPRLLRSSGIDLKINHQ